MAELTKTVEYVKQKCLQCSGEFVFDKSRTVCPQCEGGELLAIAADPLIGMTLAGKFRIDSLLGCGGMGRVYAGFHEYLNVPIAIKMIPDTGMTVDRLQRFQHEANRAHALTHPNLIRVLDFGVIPAPFIVMERATGSPLSELIKQKKGLDAKTSINIGMQICDGVAAAHKAGLLHRDLKPSNVIVDMDSNIVKIIDFGLVKSFVDDVKLTRTGETVGSPPYMSPEQCRGEQMDERSDIYSFGCTLYEILTGVIPFDGDSMIASIFKHLETEAAPLSKVRPDLSFPKGLETVIKNCLSKNVQTRYQSMAEVKCDLQNVLDRKKVALIAPRGADKKKNGARKLLLMFACTTFIVVLLPILNWVFREQPPAVVPNPNALAVGTNSKVSGKICIMPQQSICLNGFSKEQLFALRQKQLDQYSNLLETTYTPFEPIYKNIDFSKPWLSFEGVEFLGKSGPTVVQGLSCLSKPLANPLLLICDSMWDIPDWRRGFIKNPKRISQFPYDGNIKSWTLNPSQSSSEVTYDVVDYYENILELNDWTTYGTGTMESWCNTTNALDFGYNYMNVTLQTDQGKQLLTPQPRRIYEIYHENPSFLGMDCNCAHVPAAENAHYGVETVIPHSATKTYELYKAEPKAPGQKPDFTFVVKYEYEAKALTDLKYLNERLEKVIAADGPDATTLLSIYRRLGGEYKRQQKFMESLESYGQAVRIASMHAEASDDLNDYILPELVSASAGHCDAIDQLKAARTWSPKTKALVCKAMSSVQ